MHRDNLCTEWSEDGKGLVKVQGAMVAVPNLILGEVAEIEIRKNSKFGKVKRLVKPSSQRIKPPCKYYEACGACHIQHLSDHLQAQFKQWVATKHLGQFGQVKPILTMADPWRYRNKAHITYGLKGKTEIISGLYQEGSHQLVPIESCLVQPEIVDAIASTIRKFLKSFKIQPFDEDRQVGLFRHILVRVGQKSKEVMVVLVLSDPRMPSKKNFVQALVKAHPEITTILLNVNKAKTSMVLGKTVECLYGPGVIKDQLLDMTFEMSPSSFYQINPIQTEKLYTYAIECAQLSGKESVIDAYCGVGTIGMIASKKAKQVLSVESNPEAVQAAQRNLQLNGIQNVKVVTADAGEYMRQLAHKKQPVDVLFMDPPRAGADEAFIQSTLQLGPQRIVYVSCNVITQARDLQLLTAGGYKVMEIQPVDMFPHSYHVETVVLMSRKDK